MDPAKVEQAAKSLSHKATGPRSSAGKQRSKNNAVKHGGSAKQLLLKGESLAANEALWNGLWENFKPEGTLLTEIFRDIFMNRLNNRRFQKASNASLAERVQFSEINRSESQQDRAWYMERYGRAEDGMLKPGGNHFELRKCIEILEDVHDSVENYGFDVGNVPHLLRKLYGTDFDGAAVGLYDLYVQLARCAQATAGGEQSADPDKFKRIMLRLLDIEIGKVTELEKTALGMERKRRKYKMDQALVFPQEAMDLNIRYETHFARDLVRLLRLYESARRMCKGLPVLPPVEPDN